MTDVPQLLASRYEIGERIGRGGMADVYRGTDTRLGRRVAIKLLKPSLAVDPRFRLMFREEAQKAARMAHPTIVRVFDAGEETLARADDSEVQIPYIIMEFVDGRLLKDIISDGPLSPAEAVRIVVQVLTALEYSHRALLVHRDIKPGNIMVTQTGQVKVMDFGIARAVSDNSATVAETGAVLGTAQYFSPEQARGETVDARTDLYSTGIILFELLTGMAPFRGDRPAAVAYQHISEPPVAPSTLNPAVSPALDTVVLHALSKDKFARYQTAAEFRSELDLAASGQLPERVAQAPDATASLFGLNPASDLSTEAAFRQLTTPDTDRVPRTQSRPPVAWIWAGVTLMIAILVGVVIWLVNLPSDDNNLGSNLSVSVPSVVGATFASGKETLDELGLVASELGQASDTVAEGLIISTDPEAGTRVGPSQVIRVYVSLGKNPTTVPRLEQLSEDAARQALVDRKLTYGVTNPEYSPSVPAGTVIGSAPESGQSVREGDVVDLIVSNGLVQVPSMLGQPISTATTTLSALGLGVVPRPDSTCTGGNVTSQSLAAGDQPQGSSVTLAFCAG